MSEHMTERCRRQATASVALCLCLLVAGDTVAGEAGGLWEQLEAASRSAVDGVPHRSAVVQGVPLVRRTGEVSEECAAVASVLSCYNSGPPNENRFFDGDPNVVARIPNAARLTGGKELEQTCVEAYSKRMKDLSSRMQAQAYGGLPIKDRGTRGQAMARMLWGMTRSTAGGGIEGAVREFLRDRLYVPRVRREMASYEAGRALIDNGVPFLLLERQRSGTVLCLGYLEREGHRYVVQSEPSSVEFELRSHAEMIRGNSDFVQRLRLKMKELDEQFGHMSLDYRFAIATAKDRAGIKIVEWPPQADMVIVCLPQPSDELVGQFCKEVSREAQRKRENGK